MTPTPLPTATPIATTVPTLTPGPSATPGATVGLLNVTSAAETTGRVYSLSVTNLPAATAKVQLLLDDHDLYDAGNRVEPLSSPFQLSRWHSRNVLDGPHWFSACAYDAVNNKLGCTPEVAVTIANGPKFNERGVTAKGTLTLVSPANPDAPLSGIVSVSLAATGEYSAAASISYNCTIDGMPLAGPYAQVITKYGSGSSSGAWSMDTRNWPNGTRKLYCWAWRSDDVTFASYTKRLTFANGHQPMALSAGYNEVHLNSGESIQLSPAMLYTDGPATALTPSLATYAIQTNPSTVASVSSSGLVTAGTTKGIARINVSYNGKTTFVYVFTHADKARFSHFGKDGNLHDTYNSASSLWLRTMFWSRADRFFLPSASDSSVPGGYPTCASDGTCMSTKLAAAGFNAFTDGFYGMNSPCNGRSWSQLKSEFDSIWTTDGSLGQFLGLTGGANYNRTGNLYFYYDAGHLFDDWTMRDIGNTSGNCPDAARLVQYSLSKIKTEGRAIAFNTKDEIDGAFGSTPFPPLGSNTWMGPYGLPDTIFKTIFGLMDGSPVLEPGYTRASRPPMTNAIISIASADSKINWQRNNPSADFNETYWTNTVVADPAGINNSLPILVNRMDDAIRGTESELPLNQFKIDRATMLQCGSMGANYYKLATNRTIQNPRNSSEYWTPPYFQPEYDSLAHTGFAVDELHGLCAWFAVARGMAGIHWYAFEGREQTREKGFKPAVPSGQSFIFDYEMQTGTNWQVGPSRWAAMSASQNLMAAIEPYLVQPPTQAPDLGPYIITGARKGQAGIGNLLIVLNANQSPRTITVPLSEQSAGKTAGKRYRVLNSRSVSMSIPVTTSDTVTLEPSEVAVYTYW